MVFFNSLYMEMGKPAAIIRRHADAAEYCSRLKLLVHSYMQMRAEVRKYYNELRSWFLHDDARPPPVFLGVVAIDTKNVVLVINRHRSCCRHIEIYTKMNIALILIKITPAPQDAPIFQPSAIRKINSEPLMQAIDKVLADGWIKERIRCSDGLRC